MHSKNQNAIFDRHFNNLCKRRPELSDMRDRCFKAVELMTDCFQRGGTLYLCGNGGSAADAEHIAGELMKGFLHPRHLTSNETDGIKALSTSISASAENSRLLNEGLQKGLRAIPLVSFMSLNTAVANDNHADLVFAQSLYALGAAGDILWAISTSGKARNVELAAYCAKAMNIRVVAMTGECGGELRKYADVLLNVPAKETFLAQEMHQSIYHVICAALEEIIFAS